NLVRRAEHPRRFRRYDFDPVRLEHETRAEPASAAGVEGRIADAHNGTLAERRKLYCGERGAAFDEVEVVREKTPSGHGQHGSLSQAKIAFEEFDGAGPGVLRRRHVRLLFQRITGRRRQFWIVLLAQESVHRALVIPA